jgi:hypothetical protein
LFPIFVNTFQYFKSSSEESSTTTASGTGRFCTVSFVLDI